MYGPVDLYNHVEPWSRPALARGAAPAANPILSDLAFAYIPWRAAVRESIANGRAPLWNRFLLAGNPLLGSASAAVFHPATWLAVFLPGPLSWTFTCAFTLFLALLGAWAFFRELELDPLCALVGAVGWAFSTYMVFFLGWSVGLSTASFPLLLLGLSRIARGRGGVGLTVAAFLLSFAGGHPESTLHIVAAGAVYFVWELLRRGRRRRAAALGAAVLSAVLGLALAGPQLLPILEAVQHSAEYRTRRGPVEAGRASQSVDAEEAARRLLPAVLPFAHGIYGKSPVQAEREDGSGMPLAYGGAVLFALAGVGFFRKGEPAERRGRAIFLVFVVAGLLLGASAPGLIDLLTKLPLFSLALNYRLVFLTALGLSALAALGAERVLSERSGRTLVWTSLGCAALLTLAFAFARGVFLERALPEEFVRGAFAREVVPLLALAAAAAVPALRGRRLVFAALVILVAQRGLEMKGTYPTLPKEEYAPPLSTLATLPDGAGPYRVTAPGDVFRPNGSALYGLEDSRGYESLLLARFADTYPLWCRPQFASFNRVDDLASPFLSFLNVRFAIAPPDAPVPTGWREWARGGEMAIFENPRALPRAFPPRRVRWESDSARTLEAMSGASDFSDVVWITGVAAPEVENPTAELLLRSVGPDLQVTAEVSDRVFVATSLPDWPGWEARSGTATLPLVTVNHAFVGFWLAPGRHVVHLSYNPASFRFGVALWGTALLALAMTSLVRRRRALPSIPV